MKFIKNSFIVLMLLSYAATVIPMEPMNAGKVIEPDENAQVHANGQNEPVNQPSRVIKFLNYAEEFAWYAWVFNAVNNVKSLAAFKPYLLSYLLKDKSLPTLAQLNSSHLYYPDQKVTQLRNMLLNMGVSPSTIIDAHDRVAYRASADGGQLYINPSNFYDVDFEEQKFTLAHEGSHIVHKDDLKQGLFGLAASFATFSALAGYYYGSKYVIEKLKNKYPAWKKALERLNFFNKYIVFSPITCHLITGYLRSWYAQSHELRADMDAAKLVGPYAGIKMFKNLKDQELFRRPPSTVEVITQKIRNILELMAGGSTHPSMDVRIKALEDYAATLPPVVEVKPSWWQWTKGLIGKK